MTATYILKKIPRELDRRIKIDDVLRGRIKVFYFEGMPQRQIARETGVSRRAISFILFPERLERNKKLYKERRKDKRYYNKDKHWIATKKHRAYKKSIILNLI